MAVIGLLTAIVTNADRATVLVKQFSHAAPRPTQEWKHFSEESGTDLMNRLNLIRPSPGDVAASASWPNLHVWYRGGGTGTKYVYREIPYHDGHEDQPNTQFFFNDGKIVPIGFGFNDSHTIEIFTYLEVSK